MVECSECKKFYDCLYGGELVGRLTSCPDFQQKPQTNVDRIRAMSDEQLAEFLNRVKEPCDCCQLAVVEGACTETLCDDAMTKWLKQPAEG